MNYMQREDACRGSRSPPRGAGSVQNGSEVGSNCRWRIVGFQRKAVEINSSRLHGRSRMPKATAISMVFAVLSLSGIKSE